METDTERAFRAILARISGLDRDTVMVAAMALRAGWLTDGEREELAPLADALDDLSQSYGTSAEASSDA